MSAGGATATDVANEALGILGVKPITDIMDTGTLAEACRRMFPVTKKSLFRSHPWNSLLARATTSPDAKTPVWGFSYRHKLPTGCMRLWKINGFRLPYKQFRVESGFILANDNYLELLFVKDTDNYSTLDPSLYEALAYRLAIKIHRLVGAKTKNIGDVIQTYQDVLGDAILADSAETQEEVPIGADDWEMYRQTSQDGVPWPSDFVDVEDI